MKLNRKGYMLVEIIVAFTLAMSIAYYLLNLAFKFKNTDEDIYMQTQYMQDKIIITKNIMNDLERGTISEVESSDNEVNFYIWIYNSNNNTDERQKRKIKIHKTDTETIIEYGRVDEEGQYMTSDRSYYKKQIETSLQTSSIAYTPANNGDKIITITIPLQSIYDDNDYSIKLLAQLH